MRFACSLVLLAALGACGAEPPVGASPIEGAAQPLPRGDARLVRDRVVWTAPAGGDGAPAYTLAWEQPDGSRVPADIGPVVHAVVWRGAIAYVDPRRRLWREGDSAPLAQGVVDAPAVSPDGAWLAYVVPVESQDGTHAEVHLRGADADRVLDRSLYTFGALRFSVDGEALFGVGSDNGGVAGLHVIDIRTGARRCLSNCALRVGQPWGDAFLPPPGSTSELRFEGDEVVFDTPRGVARLRWREGAR